MSITVSEVMVRNPIVLRPEQSLFSARELMVIHEYECLFVVDEKRKPIGVVTTLFTSLEEPKKTVEKVMKTEFQVIRETQLVQEAANMFTSGGMSLLALPVVDAGGALVGILRLKELVQDLVTPPKEGVLTPEAGVIYLAMTKNEDKERIWLDRIREHGHRPAVTQVGANAEKLPIKMRESAIVAAIAFGVIKEDTREKMAVSNAIRDIILQLKMISPGLGGGFKIGIVRGDGRIAVAAFGRCGHALSNSPEQVFLGSSII
jgi:acetoin utilization protein AcuB